MQKDALKDHIERKVAEIEEFLPQNSWVAVSVRRQALKIFSADLRAKVFGRWLSVSAQGDNLHATLNEARRHLLRRVEHIRDRRISKRHDRTTRLRLIEKV